MGRIVVNAMPTAESPDGRARAADQGFGEFTRVREGKRLLLSVAGPVTEAHLARARELGARLVGEGYEVTGVHGEGSTVVVGSMDEWDEVYAEGIGAIAPIPAGAGEHVGRHHGRADVALDQRVEGFGTGVYAGEDD
ncbi:hypothetical protein [Arsenicicoccus dermatophilus]|uniref:hypothetical protein n=1 Tax=Arsenicicoccus dermatophilus TaxID=1076331 RepID=UPI003917269E